MARFTYIGARDMSGGFTGCIDSVMTLNAISGHAGVIERRAVKTAGVMAHVALRRGRNVIG